jgi:hypothetical protein
MVDNNPTHMITVNKKADELFAQVKELEVKYVEWTVLDRIDIQKNIKEFKNVDDWKTNF